jgi:5-formyltetrahydrofolate cyclo-ligase
MVKSEIRQKMTTARNSLRDSDVKSRSSSILYGLEDLSPYKEASLILTYVSFQKEVDTKPLIQRALDAGKRIAVPACIPKGKILLPCEIRSLDELVPGTWGILEPPENSRKVVPAEEIDLAVVPGLAFDRQFNRLGYGAGYYDRFLPKLKKKAVKAGICYSIQLIDQIPVEAFDIAMDIIVTDTEVLVRR